MTLRQNIHIGICNGAAMEKPFGKAIALAFVAEYLLEPEQSSLVISQTDSRSVGWSVVGYLVG